MAIRAVAVDIDGTVTDMDKRLYWSAVEALRAVEAQGIPVMPATGNVMPVTKSFSAFLGLSGPLVCENGGAVYALDLSTKRILNSRDPGERALAHLQAEGIDARPLWSDPWRESEVAIQLNVDPEDVARALDGWEIDVVPTRFAIHLVEPGLDKGHGVAAALEMMGDGIGMDEVLAIGDSRNDVEMLAAAGASAAVGNATSEAKEAAQYVAEAVHGDGVAEALRHFGFADGA